MTDLDLAAVQARADAAAPRLAKSTAYDRTEYITASAADVSALLACIASLESERELLATRTDLATENARLRQERDEARAMNFRMLGDQKNLGLRLGNAVAERDDYAARLKAGDDAYRRQCIALCEAEAQVEAMRAVVEAAIALDAGFKARKPGGGSDELCRLERAVGVYNGEYPQAETDTASTTSPHIYLSTGCLHGQHDYCAAGLARLDGTVKKPSQCKFCAAACICECHSEGPSGPLSATEPAQKGEVIPEWERELLDRQAAAEAEQIDRSSVNAPVDPAGPKLLGPDGEPQNSGAVVAVHFGDYRSQEIWVRSGANIGNWYPLGGEFWAAWDRPQMSIYGVTKQHPTWDDVLARGPVTLLVAAALETYLQGWRAGRRDLWQSMEEIAEEDPDVG